MDSTLPETMPETSVPALQDRLGFIQNNYQVLRESLQKAQVDYKKHFDRKWRENPAFKVGDKVWLSTANLKLACPLQKLGPRYIGPFQIKWEINPVAYEVSPPDSYRIHLVFHTSLLKPTVPDPFPGRAEPPPPVTIGEDTEFEVESILNCRKRGRQTQFLIK